MSQQISDQSFSFSVDSALLRELGEKLVSTVHVAVSELIKNAYDADADHVKVFITPSEHGGGPTVVIEDDGVGMTPEDVTNFWMRIGTTHKADQPTSSRYGRPRTGRKGVGRFACRRLGSKLVLETIANSVAEDGSPCSIRTVVDFDWPEFEPGTTVESIVCKGRTETSSDLLPTGTRLEISNAVVDEWRNRGYDYVRRQLAVIASNRGASREGFEEDPGFRVFLKTPESGDEPEDLRERVIEASWGTLDAEVRPDGKAVFSLTAKGIGGRKTFTTSPLFSAIEGATLHLGILPISKTEGARDTSVLAGYVLTNIIEEWGGVQVRYNGFRMYPYGNPGDDWLRIDADRGRRWGRVESADLIKFASSLTEVDTTRVLLNMLGMRNFLGQVEVPSSIAGLEPRLDRQGFIQSPTFELLRQFVRTAIEWATIHRESYVRQRRQLEARQAIEDIAPIIGSDPKGLGDSAAPKATQFLKREITRLVTTLPPDEQAQTRESLLKTVKALEAISAESQHQLRHLRLLASASTLTLLFAHEVRSSIASLGAGAARLRGLAKRLPAHRDELLALGSQFSSSQNQLTRLVDMTGIVGAFRTDQTLEDVHLRSSVDRAVSCFNLVSDAYQIEMDSSGVKASLSVGPMIIGEVYSILINILSNSVKSLIASGQVHKRIEIRAESSGSQVLVRIQDNGLGLDPGFYSDVFTPFIADPAGELYDKLQENANPEDAALFGTGSGLGLSIARDIARARKGDIRFVPPDDNWNACVEIQLP
jgi:signal transduction histidine kinase